MTPAESAAVAAEVPIAEARYDDEDLDLVCLVTNDTAPNSKKYYKWYIDCGATGHMTFDRSVFATYEEIEPFSIEMGDKSTAVAVGRGCWKLQE